ncbi:MAG: imidazoleglycerol-phosphate dehydratase HisB [Firmicutes bacterium]|nr:imidazoleglycerol-phosphate dehydratase HisB [Bacillota bacterium]
MPVLWRYVITNKEAGRLARTATLSRETRETKINLTLNLDGTGKHQISTGIGFFDHMLSHLAYQSLIDLTVTAQGDLEVDGHHTVEDIGIVLGEALREALGNKQGIHRYGTALVPMDEALVLAAVDFSGRSFLHYDLALGEGKVGNFDLELAEEFFAALCRSGITLHLRSLAGKNRHHLMEAAFKALGQAFRQAIALDPRREGVPSTKGVLL